METDLDLDRGREELRRRLRELAAVYRLAEAVVSTERLDEILHEALDALLEALAVDRAAVLLRDEGGVMRFRAWRGLSDEYRAAVEGHSPWTGDEDEFPTIAIADVETDATLDAGLRRAVLREGIRSVAFVPLVHRRKLLGKFMLYGDAPYEFTEADLQLAQTLASTVAGATQRASTEEELRASRHRLDLILQRVADGITVQDPAGRLLFANDAAARIIGFESAEELVGTPVATVMERFELLDEDGRPLAVEQLPGRRALAGEESERLVGYRLRATGEVRWSIVNATPVFAPDGQVDFAINVFRDITDRRRQEERLAFLARAGEVLGRSLDYSRTLAEVARLVVPAIGDWCMVYVEEPDGEIRRIAVEHFGGRHTGLLERLESFPFNPEAEVGVPAVLRTGEPQLHAEATSRLVASDVFEGERLAAQLEELGIRSWMCVPLTARGRTFGAMSFLSTESGRRFDAIDLELAEELATRAALAVDNARLYQQAQESFGRLETLLASAPVGIGFWDTDIRYVRVNEKLAELNGLPAEEHLGKTLWDVIPDLAAALEPVYRGVVESGEPLVRHEASTDLAARRLGRARHWLSSYFPVKTPDGETLGVGAVIMEITERKMAEEEAAARARQQADVAALGQLALSGARLDVLMDDTVERVARTLGVEYAKILELLPDGTALRLRAGVGWREGLVGTATVSAGPESQAGFTLISHEPVVVEDLRRETRFSGPQLLHEHGVVSGMSVVVGRGDRPFGVLGVHAAEPRVFTDDDVNYLQSVANVLAAAVDQRRLAELERAARERLTFIADASRLLASSLDYETTLRNVADLAATPIADWILVYLLDEEGSLRRIVGRHADPSLQPVVAELAEYVPRLDQAHPIRRAVEDGESTLLERIPVELLAGGAVDEHHLELLRRVGLSSALTVPITVARTPVGAIGFARSGGTSYTREDLALAEELGRRAGLAIENARLYEASQYQSRLTQTIADNAASALFFVGEDGCPTYMNESAAAMTGYTLEEVRERPLHYAVHHSRPDGTPYPIEECPIDRALPRHQPVGPYEDVFVRKDGTFFPVIAAASPIVSDGRLVGTVVEVRDITLEKELLAREQEARREAEARAQAAQALAFVGDGVLLLDRRSIVRLWNPAAEAITGIRAEDVVGLSADQAIPGWSALASRIPVSEAGARTSARPETLPLDVGGAELWLSISGVGFADGTVFAFRDVTEERGVEKLKSDFVSTISHELRTPLAAIYGAALTLRRGDMELEHGQRTDLLGVIASEAERLARIVNDILWTSRIESGGLQVTIEACDPVELAQGVVQAAVLQLPDNLRLALRTEPDTPALAADPDKVRQVIANLVDNAVKYSPDGGTVELRVIPAGERVRFVVRDEGLGIPAREQERVFEKFYRLDPDLTRGVGGTGLGLYICRELVNRMGGRIWFESEEGLGSTVVVELPVVGTGTSGGPAASSFRLLR